MNHPSAHNNFRIFFERGIGRKSNVVLEHGCGVQQDIELAAEDYKFAGDHGHSEAQWNYEFLIVFSNFCPINPSDDSLTNDFIACLEEPGFLTTDYTELLASIARFKGSITSQANHFTPPANLQEKSELGKGDSSQQNQLFEHEADMLKTLKHPFILEFCKHTPGDQTNCASIVSEFAVNGSLADHLPWADADFEGCDKIVIR
jgi:hypothetical protein